MTAMGMSGLLGGRILHHAESRVTTVYDRHSYDKQKYEALDTWERRRMMIVSGLRKASETEAWLT